MDPLLVSLLACAFMLGGALTGMYLRRALPERHLDGETKEIVRLGAALLATVAALVLSLLINSANQSFEDKRGRVERVASDVALLDRLLAAYGPEAREVRVLVRRGVDIIAQRAWNIDGGAAGVEPGTIGVETFSALKALPDRSEIQRALRDQALLLAMDIARARVALFEHARTTLPWPIVAILIFWFTVLFASFCLFSPVNGTGFGALIAIAVSASAALFMFLEMGQAFSGFIQISDSALIAALPPLAH